MKILITGIAGFIGANLALKLLRLPQEMHIIGIDNMNGKYDVSLKEYRLSCIYNLYNDYLQSRDGKLHAKSLNIIKADTCNQRLVNEIFEKYKPEIVVHLAAHAGVRYSLNSPQEVLSQNIIGMINVLESCRKYNVIKLIYASSSSVYGNSKRYPFTEDLFIQNQISPYASSKKCCEDLAQCYSSIYGLLCIGLRFFTVYGPWGRPDMAPLIFAHAIKENKPVTLYNQGNLSRDFTYIDDAINGILLAIDNAQWNTSSSNHHLYNIGYGYSVPIIDLLHLIEKGLGHSAIVYYAPKPDCDVECTFADITKAMTELGYKPKYTINDGIPLFLDWFNQYYK